MKISAAIITYNEEKNIERCLNSLIGVVEEIVVVDSFSTDRTKEICEKYNCRFIHRAFEGHIEQKNAAMAEAKHEWILSLDADEELSPELKRSITELRESVIVDAYSFNRLNNYCGKWIRHSGWYPDRKIRLWNRNKGKWEGENPHDKVIMKDSASVQWIEGNLHHYSYTNTSEHDLQLRKFAEISAQAKFKKGQTAGYLKMYWSSAFKFLRNYFFKLGFLDGKDGWIICKKSALENYLKYKRLHELHKQSIN